MSQIVTQNQNLPVPHNPFQRMQNSHVNAGTIAVESERAIAEAQAKMVIAKRFPRDEAAAFSKVMTACQRKTLAESAFYSYPRGGETVSGPSIRLAEELARCWGNVEYGIRELSRKDGVSEMQAFAIDLENNIHSVQNFTVRHIRDRRGGGKELTDERDIYELTANMGGRRLRARILAVLPPDLKEAAVLECKRTLARDDGGELTLEDRVKRMIMAFKKLGVSEDLLVNHLKHPLDQINADELADLYGIYTSIKDGVTKIADWFGEGEQEAPKAGINAMVQSKVEAAATEKADTPEQKASKDEEKGSKNTKNTARTKQDPEPEQRVDSAPAADDDRVF